MADPTNGSISPDAVIAAIKAFQDDSTPRVIQRSVEETPGPNWLAPGGGGNGFANGFLGWIGMGGLGSIDGIPAWGTSIKARDAMLRQMVTKEPIMQGSFATIVARNAAYSWNVTGGTRLRDRSFEMLHAAEFGKGWLEFISKLSWDYLTQDIGAWVETIREEPRAEAPVIGIKTLDAACIWPTGDPEHPAWYWDRLSGNMHKMAWWQVTQISESPTHHPVYYDLQRSAMTRVLEYVTLWRGINQYIKEKTTGRNSRAVHIVAGVNAQMVNDALAKQQSTADQIGVMQYIAPLIFGNPDPASRASVATLELASLPDGWNLKEQFEIYLTILALGLLTDYQELAPLQSGNIGTSQQTTTLDEKAKRKGAQLFRKRITAFVNSILPASVEFGYDEQDVTEDVQTATAKKLRAEARSLMIQNAEIDAAGARQIAVDEGDMSDELFAEMNAHDLTLGPLTDDSRVSAIEAAMRNAGIEMPQAPLIGRNIIGVGGFDPGIDVPGQPKRATRGPNTGGSNSRQRVVDAGPADDEDQATKAIDPVMAGRDDLEPSAERAVERRLGRMRRSIESRLREVE